MGHTDTGRRRQFWLWALGLLALLALRVPAFVAPAGNDQSLYMYVADRILDGGSPYVDAWDQKPPAVFFVYGALRAVWPHASAVALADLVAAGLTAWLLVLLGRRTIGTSAGFIAAALFLLFSHPSLGRVSGVYIRGQCEVFIAPVVALALLLLVRSHATRWHVLGAGVALGAAFWLKYNALAYALPLVVAMWLWRPRRFANEALTLGTGFAAVSLVIIGFVAAHRALGAMWLATIDYNLRYSGETYRSGAGGALAYLATMPFAHARVDMLWFLGSAGVAWLVFTALRSHARVVALVVAWLAAAVISIAINGARDLPQYFVQAAPALAFAGAAGMTLAWQRGRTTQAIVALVLVGGLWKVGVEAPSFAGARWAGLPQLADNVAFDLRYMSGRIDRDTYLSRFKGAQKFDAAAYAGLADTLRSTTTAADRIFVFGFAPGVYLDSQRQSASRFFWSRPVILEFAADHEGYGSAGLLRDLDATKPAVVTLQKQDWRPDVANSRDFFKATPALNAWLTSHYTLDDDAPIFEVWRRKP